MHVAALFLQSNQTENFSPGEGMLKSCLWGVLILCFTACTAPSEPISGLRLVSDVTLGPATLIPPTRIISPTPPPVTPEIVSPLQAITLDAAYVLVTPTLPPSKTPTLTPTQSLTPTQTQTPTTTVTATATIFLLPTSVIIPVTREVAAPANEVCETTWFFIQPRPPACPVNPPNSTQGVYQEFQTGYMIWVQSQDAIYVLYNDNRSPRWQVFRDYYVDGMDEVAGEYLEAPSPGLWQPRRGFGLLWRGDQILRSRVGWATQEWELPYPVKVQTARDGAIFISQPGDTAVFSLMPGGANWTLYDGSMPTLPTPIFSSAPGPFVMPSPIPSGG